MTRKHEFIEAMEHVVPWTVLAQIVEQLLLSSSRNLHCPRCKH